MLSYSSTAVLTAAVLTAAVHTAYHAAQDASKKTDLFMLVQYEKVGID